MAQGIKVEQLIQDLFFITWLLLNAYFFQGSGIAAADKRGEPQEGGCAPLLRFSPFEIPFPYLPLVRSTWVGFIGFLLSVQRAEDR